jgi:hypothetical protein
MTKLVNFLSEVIPKIQGIGGYPIRKDTPSLPTPTILYINSGS